MNVEDLLLILLLAYVIAFTSLGVVRGRKYLKGYRSPESTKYQFHSVDVVLTLAGLAMTALALFVSFGFQSLEQLSPMILFFSISFVTLVLSSVVTRFPRRVYMFLADVLADTGYLAIGCGFFVFFRSHSQDAASLMFGIFIAAFILLSCLNFWRYYKYWKSF